MNALASFASRPNCLMIYFLLNLKFEVPDVPPKGENTRQLAGNLANGMGTRTPRVER